MLDDLLRGFSRPVKVIALKCEIIEIKSPGAPIHGMTNVRLVPKADIGRP